MPIATNPETGESVFLASSGQWEPARTAVNPQTQEKVVFDGQQWVPAPGPEKGVLGTLDDIARSIARGATFGAADVIGAKVNPAINAAINKVFGTDIDVPETSEAALAEERRRTADVPTAIALPGQIAGAIGTTVLAAPLAGAGMAAAGLSGVPRAAQFAALGAAEAGAQGAFDAPSGEELQGALESAPVGALVGGAAPGVISGVSGLINRIRTAVGPQANVAADLGRAIARDADTPATLQARAAGAAAERPGVANIADAGGENVRGLVERVAQTPGAGRRQVIPALQGRQRAQAGRITSDLRQLTGTDRSAFQAINETIAQRARESAPLYRQAFTEGDRPLRSPEIDRLMSSDLVVKAMKRAISSGRDRAVREGLGSFNPAVKVTDDGRVLFAGRSPATATEFPNLQFWDQVKRELDQLGQQSGREGLSDTASNARGLARLLREELDRLTVDPQTGQSVYRQARNLWSGDQAYLDAIDAGRNIRATNMSAEEMAGNFNALNPVEQEGFRTGAISALIARMGNDASKFGDMTKFVRSPEMRAKIATIMPTQELRDAWARRLEFEVGASELTSQALGNSATARRLAERADAEGVMGDLILDAFSGAGSTTILRRVLTAGPRWLRDTVRARADTELADVLTNPARINDLDAILARAAADRAPASGSGALTAAGVAAESEF